MALKQAVTTEEHGLLDAALKALYKQSGTGFILDVEGIDNITGLTSALASERSRANTAEGALKPYQTAGLTPERITSLLALEQAGKVGSLTSKGEYDQALELVKQGHTTQLTAMQEKLNEQALDHGLDSVLLKAGVIQERLPVAKKAARDYVRVAEGGALEVIDPATKQLNGKKPEEFFAGDFKTQHLYLFNGNGGAGSGAQNNMTPGAAEVPVKTRAEFNALTPQQKVDFSELVGAGKAQLVNG